MLIREQLVGVAQEAASVLIEVMRQRRLVRSRLRACESILDRVGVAKVTRTETVALDPGAVDEAELLRYVDSGALLRYEALLTEAEAILADARARRDAGGQPWTWPTTPKARDGPGRDVRTEPIPEVPPALSTYGDEDRGVLFEEEP